MTQIFSEDNVLVPVTVIEAGPCPVTQIKTTETDGYNAVQIGYGAKKDKNTSAGMAGHFKKAQVSAQRMLTEVRTDAAPTVALGASLTVAGFQGVDKVDVIGISKGRGFQGVMKRHGFQGQPASHGHMMHRRPGSIGMRQTPGHVFKNKPMPGHMGQVQRTVQNLKVVKVLEDKNLILVKGSIPGANGTPVLVRTAIKAKKSA